MNHYLAEINYCLLLLCQISILDLDQRIHDHLHLVAYHLFGLVHHVALADYLAHVIPAAPSRVHVIHQSDARISVMDVLQPLLQLPARLLLVIPHRHRAQRDNTRAH